MKSHHISTLVLVLFFFFAGGLNAQTPIEEDSEDQTEDPIPPESKYPEDVVIRLIEWHEGTVGDKSKMIVIKPDNTVETIELEKSKLVKGEAAGVINNMIKLRTEIQKWHNFGFSIKSSCASSPSTYITLTTIVLQKN